MRKPRLEPKIDDQKEKARIHTVLNRLEGIKNKKQFLNDTIKFTTIRVTGYYPVKYAIIIQIWQSIVKCY